jgi:hypothetical protein
MWAASACGGSTTTTGMPVSGDGGGDGAVGSCGNTQPIGGSCNGVTNVAAPITPTCASGTMPTGTGGTLVDGTYVLSQQTYYNFPGCPFEAIAATLELSGTCIEAAARAGTSDTFTSNATATQQGNQITIDVTCSSLAGGTPDTPTRTFTASGSTLTWFIHNSAAGNANPDRVEAYTKQ